MTRGEAKAEAVRRWGARGWACFFPVAASQGKPGYEVGNGLEGDARIGGAGATWAEAFQNAESGGAS